MWWAKLLGLKWSITRNHARQTPRAAVAWRERKAPRACLWRGRKQPRPLGSRTTCLSYLRIVQLAFDVRTGPLCIHFVINIDSVDTYFGRRTRRWKGQSQGQIILWIVLRFLHTFVAFFTHCWCVRPQTQCLLWNGRCVLLLHCCCFVWLVAITDTYSTTYEQ